MSGSSQVVHEAGAQNSSLILPGGREDRLAPFLQIVRDHVCVDGLTQCVKRLEQDHVPDRRCCESEGRARLDQVSEVVGEDDAVGDCLSEGSDATASHDDVGGEALERTTECHPVVDGPVRTTCKGLARTQIARISREGRTVRRSISHQQDSRRERPRKPLVQIEREAVRTIDTAHGFVEGGRSDSELSPEGSIDMEPEVFSSADIHDFVEPVTGSGVHHAGGRDDTHRELALLVVDGLTDLSGHRP